MTKKEEKQALEFPSKSEYNSQNIINCVRFHFSDFVSTKNTPFHLFPWRGGTKVTHFDISTPLVLSWVTESEERRGFYQQKSGRLINYKTRFDWICIVNGNVSKRQKERFTIQFRRRDDVKWRSPLAFVLSPVILLIHFGINDSRLSKITLSGDKVSDKFSFSLFLICSCRGLN